MTFYRNSVDKQINKQCQAAVVTHQSSNSGQVNKLKLHHSYWRIVRIDSKGVLVNRKTSLASCTFLVVLQSTSAVYLDTTLCTKELLVKLVSVLWELSTCRETFATNSAVINFPCFFVHLQHVALQRCLAEESFVAKFTEIIIHVCMNLEMLLQSGFCKKFFRALATLLPFPRFFSVTPLIVNNQVWRCIFCAAKWARDLLGFRSIL